MDPHAPKKTQLLEGLHFWAVLDGLKSHPSTWVPGGGPHKNFRSLIKTQIGVMAKQLKGGVVGRGVVCVPAEVHAQTPGLYQVQNWSYGQKTKKKWGKWGLKGAGRMQGSGRRST